MIFHSKLWKLGTIGITDGLNVTTRVPSLTAAGSSILALGRSSQAEGAVQISAVHLKLTCANRLGRANGEHPRLESHNQALQIRSWTERPKRPTRTNCIFDSSQALVGEGSESLKDIAWAFIHSLPLRQTDGQDQGDSHGPLVTNHSS